MQEMIQQYQQTKPLLKGSSNVWLNELRDAAISKLQTLSPPTRHDEDWKYTDLSALIKQPFNHVIERTEEPKEINALNVDCHKMVFINGVYSAKHSSNSNPVYITTLTEALSSKQAEKLWGKNLKDYFANLNQAFANCGVVIQLPAYTVLDKPLQIIHYSSANQATHIRNCFLFGSNSQATIIENFIGDTEKTYFNNILTETHLEQNAHIQHIKVQQEANSAFHIANNLVSLQSQSHYYSHVISLGAALARNEINVNLSEEHSTCALNGLYVANNNQLLDHHTQINHQKANCTSHEFYRGVIDDKAHGIFSGKIVISQDAQKSATQQRNNNLLLSATAEASSRPQLEIYADDVKCSHGSTTGQLDHDALYYMQSRGIHKAAAEKLLTLAFANEVLQQINSPVIYDEIAKLVQKKL